MDSLVPAEQKSFLQLNRVEIEDTCTQYLLKVIVGGKEETKDRIAAAKLLLERTTPSLKSISVQHTIPVTVNYESPLVAARQKLIDVEATEVSMETPLD